MNAKDLEKKLVKAGFFLDRIPGSSHRIYKKKGFTQISLPFHGAKDMKKGMIHKILKAAGLK